MIFSVTSLYLFVHSFLYFSFQYPRSCGLVESSNFKDMCRIDPIVRPASHDMVSKQLELVDRYLQSMSNFTLQQAPLHTHIAVCGRIHVAFSVCHCETPFGQAVRELLQGAGRLARSATIQAALQWLRRTSRRNCAGSARSQLARNFANPLIETRTRG